MKTASEMASWIAKTIENNSPETAAIIIMEEYNCNPYASHPSPMSAEQVDWKFLKQKFYNECTHIDTVDGREINNDITPKDIFNWIKNNLSASTTPSVKADGWVSVDKEKEFHKVLKCLKNNKVMVGTREDGIYIRLAGRESEGEAFTLHFALAYPFPKLPPHQNKNK